LGDFKAIVVCDFEYHYGTGGSSDGPPHVICGCAKELRSGQEYSIWANEFGSRPPWPYGNDTLFVCYNATAEVRSYMSLGWRPPASIVDLFIEYRQWRNGTFVQIPKEHARLTDALRYCRAHKNDPPILNPYPYPEIDAEQKKDWQALALAGGPFSQRDRCGLIEYCMDDVRALCWLLTEMTPRLPANLNRALYRGRYMVAASAAMVRGFPVDEELWQQFLKYREQILEEVIGNHPVYEGTSFRLDKFSRWLEHLRGRGMIQTWPVTASGQPSCEDKTFRRYSKVGEVEELRQIRALVKVLQEPRFEIRNGRHYYSLLPFTTKTSRNTTNHCLIQAPSCLHAFIQPKPGTCLISADFSQQEYYVAAVLSGDAEMLRLYAEGDPYMAFAIKVGLAPPGATKKTHRHEREISKTVSLAVMYGQQPFGVARKLGISYNRAQDLLIEHKRQFPRVWAWSEEEVKLGFAHKRAVTRWGWYMTVTRDTSRRTLQNFPVQGLAADILRLAHLLLMENGVSVCGPIHDAFLAEAAEEEAEEAAAKVKQVMEEAGRIVLGAGTILRADVQIIRYPERWLDRQRGGVMWDKIMGTIYRLSVVNRQAMMKTSGKCPVTYNRKF
jgi:hypothetical protein